MLVDTTNMGESTHDKMRYMVDRLNYLTLKYDEGHPEVSDKEWDDLYFTLQYFEKLMNFSYEDSPTRKVNYQVVNQLKKVEHNHKMLSLDKTKSLEDVIAFSGDKQMLVMAKLDGLTCSLKYINGRLVSAETRGDGIIGEDILHNALVIPSIPNRINYTEELIVDGEIVCLEKDFAPFKKEYKNSRNFAAGSIRLLDSKECAKRNLTFIAWDVIKGFDGDKRAYPERNMLSYKLIQIEDLGFTVVPKSCFYFAEHPTEKELLTQIQVIGDIAYKDTIPIDGIVFKFNDIAYGKALGETAHHFKNAIAYKFYDETYDTKLKDIEWSMGRTGVLTPVAIFDPVDIDGTTVQRANLHNLSIMEETLGIPFENQSIKVFKANMIIPQIYSAEKPKEKPNEKILELPRFCPVCRKAVIIKENNGVKELYCANDECLGKIINKINHFCSKKGLDIKGLSLATLEKLMDWNWIYNISDIYTLYTHRSEWIKKAGFGPKSVDNILQAIENSKTCTLESFIAALGIPLIGRNVAKELVKYFTTYEAFREAIKDKYDFSLLDGFAEAKSKALLTFDYMQADTIAHSFITFKEPKEQNNNKQLEGKKYVITGTVKQFKNRTELQKFIEDRGGKVVSSISKNVDYLINNNSASTSAKNVAAKKIGIPIISEAEFLEELS